MILNPHPTPQTLGRGIAGKLHRTCCMLALAQPPIPWGLNPCAALVESRSGWQLTPLKHCAKIAAGETPKQTQGSQKIQEPQCSPIQVQAEKLGALWCGVWLMLRRSIRAGSTDLTSPIWIPRLHAHVWSWSALQNPSQLPLPIMSDWQGS